MRARRLALRWSPLVAVVVLVAVVAATGGLARAPGVGPRVYAVGQPVELRRWVVAVEGVDLTDTSSYGSPSEPHLEVRLRVTWTENRSTELLPSGLVTVVVPGGPAASAELSEVAAGGYSGGYDPDVPRPAALTDVWPAGAGEDAPHVPAPTRVQVVVSDERPAQNFLFSDEWVTTAPLGHVDVAVTDKRTR